MSAAGENFQALSSPSADFPQLANVISTICKTIFHNLQMWFPRFAIHFLIPKIFPQLPLLFSTICFFTKYLYFFHNLPKMCIPQLCPRFLRGGNIVLSLWYQWVAVLQLRWRWRGIKSAKSELCLRFVRLKIRVTQTRNVIIMVGSISARLRSHRSCGQQVGCKQRQISVDTIV